MGREKNHDIRLKSRPSGLPTLDDFDLVESDIPSPGYGQILVRNLYMSVDPYMRGRMSDRKSYVAPFQIGEVLQGGAVGQVTTSNHNSRFREGDTVLSMNGWREWFVSDGEGLRVVDANAVPLQSYLGALGMPGLTAYVGLMRIGELKKEDRVLVSAASGAVGAIACQIARNKGCEIVVGMAGTAEKCAFLIERLGLYGAINYRAADDLSAAIAEAMPGGIDLYFDNVGGSQLEAALDNMRQDGRIVACGMIEQYNDVARPAGPRNLMNIVSRRLTMKGFIVIDHADELDRFTREMTGWIADGRMMWREMVYVGIERAPEALIGLFSGANFGKALVKLGEE
jgi:hypothetical protein